MGQSRGTQNSDARNLPGPRRGFALVFVWLRGCSTVPSLVGLQHSTTAAICCHQHPLPATITFQGKYHFQKASRSRASGLRVPQAPLTVGFPQEMSRFPSGPQQWIPSGSLLLSKHPSTPQRLSFCPLQRCPHSFPCPQSFPRLSHLGCCQSENILLLMKNKISTQGLLSFA